MTLRLKNGHYSYGEKIVEIVTNALLFAISEKPVDYGVIISDHNALVTPR